MIGWLWADRVGKPLSPLTSILGSRGWGEDEASS